MRVGHKHDWTLLCFTIMVLGIGCFASFLAERASRTTLIGARQERAAIFSTHIATAIDRQLDDLRLLADCVQADQIATTRPNRSEIDDTPLSALAASGGTHDVAIYSAIGRRLAPRDSIEHPSRLAAGLLRQANDSECFFEPCRFEDGMLILPVLLTVYDQNKRRCGFVRGRINLNACFESVANSLNHIFQDRTTHLTLANLDGETVCRIDNHASPTVPLPEDLLPQADEGRTKQTAFPGTHPPQVLLRWGEDSGRKLLTSVVIPASRHTTQMPFVLVFDEVYANAISSLRTVRALIIMVAGGLVALTYVALGCILRRERNCLNRLSQQLKDLAIGNSGWEPVGGDDEFHELSESMQELTTTLAEERESGQQDKQEIETLRAKLDFQSQQLEAESEKVEGMQLEIDQAKRSRNYFLSAMSYEIRTPLNSLLGYIELLKESVDEEDHQSHEFIEEMSASGIQLLTTIDDILDLSAIDGDRIETKISQLELLPMLSEVTARIRQRVHQNAIEFHVEFDGSIPSVVHTDAARLRQILLNLCSNAIKYTHEGRIDVRVSYDASGSQQVVIVVEDSGEGISDEQLATLFDDNPGSQSRMRRSDWSGFGLNVSRKLARSLGGDITATSKLGQGSRFRLTFDAGLTRDCPMLDSPQELWDVLTSTNAARVVTDNQSAPLNGHILLAEDSPDNQRLMAFFLRRMGAEVTVVNNGEQAVEAILNQDDRDPFDAVLLDMQMPVLDGYSAAWQLRSLGRSEPIIAVTAHAMAGEREKCLVAGCSDYIAKPINPREFEEVVCKWVKRRMREQPVNV